MAKQVTRGIIAAAGARVNSRGNLLRIYGAPCRPADAAPQPQPAPTDNIHGPIDHLQVFERLVGGLGFKTAIIHL